jgi:hypothetical protein
VTADADLDRLVAAAWPKAQERWSRFLLLRPPVADGSQPSVAHIHLGTRQVGLHYTMIRERGLADCVEAILAHEVGHHVRYPATLAVQARLLMLERALLPLPNYSVVNLFTDLLINDALRSAYEDQFVRVYQAFAADGGDRPDPAFLFYLAAYEERWGLDPGTLLGPRTAAFGASYPGYRADAQVLGDRLFHLGPNLYTQFLYFVSVVSRYVDPDDPRADGRGLACEAAGPSPDDWAEALTPDGQEREAIRRAAREGWLDEDARDRLTDPEALDRRIWSLPGQDTDDATLVPEVMAAYYRREAERFLLKPPPQRRLGEATTPTTLEDWEPGDNPREIDWPATLLAHGPALGAARPLRRDRVAEVEGWEAPLWQPRVEIYLDVSGSMPDPRTTCNAMTLAALVLATGAVRAGGWARAVLYSGAPVPFWEWSRSETELARFLMHYVGGGTEFPFDLLDQSVTECGPDQPIRVVISDTDFHVNYQQRSGAAAVARAVKASPQFILLLHVPADDLRSTAYTAAGATVIPVVNLDDYPGMAGKLAAALFERTPPAA